MIPFVVVFCGTKIEIWGTFNAKYLHTLDKYLHTNYNQKALMHGIIQMLPISPSQNALSHDTA